MGWTYDLAIQYVRRGWSVVPIIAGTKRPAIALRPYLTGEKRFDVPDCGWWVSNPNDGIAVITGRPSGIVVADYDPRNGADLPDPEKQTSQVIALTGGGGMHVFYSYPEGRDVPCGKSPKPGVDRKGDGGYVVAPPSVHPNGNHYVWERDFPATMVTPPSWLLESPEAPVNESGNRPAWVADTLADPESCLPGSQEDTLTRLCWWAAGHLEEDVANVLLYQWVSRVPLGNSRDPWTEEHISDRLSRAYQKRALEPGVAGPIVSDGPQSKREADPFEAHAMDSADFCESVSTEVQWIVPGILARGCQAEIVGNVKEGKSTLIGTLARSLVYGEPFLGREVPKVPIVWVSEQDGESLKATLRRARLDQADEGRERAIVIPRKAFVGRPWRENVAGMMQVVEQFGAQLLIVDTLMALAGVVGDAENKAGIIHEILGPFSPIMAKGCCVLYGRHASKNKDAQGSRDPFMAARGSSAIDGEVDTGILIRAHSQDSRTMYFKGRFDEQGAIALKYDDGLYVIDDRPPKLSTEDKILEAIERGFCDRDEIGREIDMSPRTVDTHIRNLFKLRQLVRRGTGAKSDPYTYHVPMVVGIEGEDNE